MNTKPLTMMEQQVFLDRAAMQRGRMSIHRGYVSNRANQIADEEDLALAEKDKRDRALVNKQQNM